MESRIEFDANVGEAFSESSPKQALSLETLIPEHDVFVAVCVDPGARADASERETPARQEFLVKDGLSQPVDDLSCAYCGHQISDSQQLVTCETCLLPFHRNGFT